MTLSRLLSVATTAAALVLSGCCSLARGLCPVEQPARPYTRLTRDTPEEALDFLIEAFRDRRIADIYATLHPDFRESQHAGGFSLSEFTSAFEEYEQLFQDDAADFAAAERSPVQRSADGQYASIALRHGDMGAIVLFRRRDVAFARFDDDFVSSSTAFVQPLGSMLQFDDDGWLQPTQKVHFDGVRGISASDVVRLEYRREWLVYDLRDVRGVRFVERMRERL